MRSKRTTFNKQYKHTFTNKISIMIKLFILLIHFWVANAPIVSKVFLNYFSREKCLAECSQGDYTQLDNWELTLINKNVSGFKNLTRLFYAFTSSTKSKPYYHKYVCGCGELGLLL